MTNTQISDRAQYILKNLIDRYIRDGQPVASRALVGDAGLGLSAATVRSVMAELEEKGYLISPHTSAGRIPTARGYRFFIDSFLTTTPLVETQLQDVYKELDPNQDLNSLFESASTLLSRLTKFAGLVTLPRRERLILRHIEFLPMADNKILVILVVNEREVQNRIIHLPKQYSESALQQAANFINQHYAGQELLWIRNTLVQALRSTKAQVYNLMQTVIDVATEALEIKTPRNDYVVSGETNLLNTMDPNHVNNLRSLFDAFTQKNDLLELLEHCLKAQGLQIFVGEESGYNVLEQYSIVTSSYSVEGQAIGVLGVIGPTRMAYDRVIPVVDVTARILSSALQGR